MGDQQDGVQLAGMIVNSIYFFVYGATASYTLWRFSKILDLFTVALMSVYIVALGCKPYVSHSVAVKVVFWTTFFILKQNPQNGGDVTITAFHQVFGLLISCVCLLILQLFVFKM